MLKTIEVWLWKHNLHFLSWQGYKYFLIAGGKGGTTTIAPPPVPTPSPEEVELQRLQLQFFKEQAPLQTELQRQQLQFFTQGLPGVTEAQQAQTELLRSLIEPTKQFAAQREALISPLLAGELPPGIFGRLGKPVGTEEASFQRGKERILASLGEAGLLSSGVRGELETQLASEIAASSEAQERADLANLLNVALGGAAGAVGETISLGGQPIATGLGGLGNIQAGIAGGQTALGGVQNTAQRIADFNRSIFQAQLEASAQQQAARQAMFGSLFQGLGTLGGGIGGGLASRGGKSSIRYKKNIKLWVKPLNYLNS